MDSDELSLGDIGLVDPVRPLPKKSRRRPDTPPAEPEIEPSPPRTWVTKVLNWMPPVELGVADVIVRFAVEGWIQEGKVGALVAAGSTGKTTLLIHLGICHATNRLFFGLKVKQGCFMLLSADDSQEDLNGAVSRVMKAMQLDDRERNLVGLRLRVVSLQGEPGLKTFTTIAGGAVMATGLEEMLYRAVTGAPDVVGVALDTLRQFSGGNSNDETVIKHTIAGATEVARRTGAYVILPHHTGKQNYREAVTDMYCGSGSAAIADNCRFVFLLQTAGWADIESKVLRTGREQGDPLVLSSTRGSLLVRPPEPLYLCRDAFLLSQIAGRALTVDQQADEKDRAILRAVRQGAQNKTAIAAAVRGRKADALSRIDDMLIRGLLGTGTGSGTGKLLVSARGATFLDDAE